MSNASSLDLVPGMIGKLNIITRGLMVRGSRPSSPAQIGFKRWCLEHIPIAWNRRLSFDNIG
jgi:hypothetical protein